MKTPLRAVRSLDLATLRNAFAAGELTPTALIEEIWRRSEAHDDPALWIHRRPLEQLRAAARQVEARGPGTQPLYGVPFAIKDNIDLAGVPTTAACPEFAYTPAESAPAVQRLIDAGAIPIGKVNLDQFATGLVGVRSPYGTPRNPFRADVIPGGSSSGSAVAVAAGLVSFALGTDTAGSGRVPAGLNNLVGWKPTRGAISTRGVVPACRSLDCVSVFALTCDDAAEVAAAMEAFDSDDPFSRPRPGVADDAAAVPRRLRVGIPARQWLSFDGDAEAERCFDDAVNRFRASGTELVEIDFRPFQEAAALLYHGPWIAERWAALRGFHRAHADSLHPVTRSILEAGREPSAADAFQGLHALAALRRQADKEWTKMDVLLLPTAPRPYTVAEVNADPLATNSRLGTYTNFVNLLDLAALAVPAGVRSDGIPWGVTFVGPAWSEARLHAIGGAWHRDSGGKLGATEVSLAAVPPAPERPRRPSPAASVRLAVVGAHLTGLPLNHQLQERGARLAWTGNTSAEYRLYALPNSTPPKPGLIRVGPGTGAAIAVEVWEMSAAAFGTFVAAIPPPLGIGTISLSNGDAVKGFLCEPIALHGAEDITSFGGWRAYLESRR